MSQVFSSIHKSASQSKQSCGLSLRDLISILTVFLEKGGPIVFCVLTFLWTSSTLPLNTLADEIPRQQLVAAFHVHSTMSTGSWTLEEVVQHTEALAIDALVLSENFVLRYEYGLFPFRGALRIHTQFPSVLEYGIRNFLEEVEHVKARHPKILLIPGVEVAPYYHWTGSLWDDTLTMHDAQKNLLVLGLSSQIDYETLPALGNTFSYQYGWHSIGSVAPALLFIPAMWLWRRSTNQRHASGTPKTRLWGKICASALGGIALGLLVNAWPFSQPQFSPYESQLSSIPYQALIDAVDNLGGIAIWSLTEAKDFSKHAIRPLGNVTIKTNPHPEVLLQTTHYNGFGGVYQDTRTITNPGGIWDQALTQYLAGDRKNPPFTYGEIAFHTQGQAGIELDQVLTVLWVQERTTAGVLEALRTGHSYAVGQYGHSYGLRLQSFSVECGKGTSSALSGETVVRQTSCIPIVMISGFATDQGTHPISIRVIRSGQVVSAYDTNTPFDIQFTDTQAPLEAPMYYRIDIHGQGELMSNPIFLTTTQ
jgi:hypothetical protein